MLGRVLLASLVLFGATLAGCIGKPEDEPVDTQETPDANNTFLDANETTEAPDGRGELAAFKETNRTETGTGGMMHAHDYWQGETRKLVTHLESGLIPLPLFPCKGDGCTVGSGDTYPPGTAIADYDIPEPGLVYEGTAQLELLLNYKRPPGAASCVEGACTPDVEHPAVTVNFDYLTAADEPRQFRTGGTLQVGQPFLIPVKPTEADMPHQTKSLWVFRVYSSEPTWFEWNITITAVKGTEVVNWPPHPDLYAEKSERTVFEGPVHLESKGTLDSNLYGSDAGWVNPERILSWGTERIEVEVKDVTLTTQTPGVTPAYFLMEYHNASKPPLLGHGTQYGGRLRDEGSDGTVYKFVIDISNDHQSYDTPYGTKSRWGFRFVPQFDQTGAACVDDSFLQQILVGCQVVPWSIDFTMTIKAYGHSTASEALPE